MKNNRLRELRKSKGFFQHQIADKCKMSQGHYSLVENGLRNPSVKVAKNIASVLNISLDEFFELWEEEGSN